MKFATFKPNHATSEILVGIVSDDDRHIQALGFDAAQAASGVAAVVRAQAAGVSLPAAGRRYDLSAIELLAPFPRPARNIFCVGKPRNSHKAALTAAQSPVMTFRPIRFFLPRCPRA
jgi:hypothetical protein